MRRAAKTVRLSWPPARDPGGLRGYRVKIGARILTVTKPAVTLNRATLRTAVSLAAVDRAGNIGPVRRSRSAACANVCEGSRAAVPTRRMTEFGYWLSSEEHRPLDLVAQRRACGGGWASRSR